MNDPSVDYALSLEMLEASSLSELSEQEFWSRAHLLARTHPRRAGPGLHQDRREYLECQLAEQRCLVPLAALRQVVSPPYRFAHLPALPAWMVGLFVWQGDVI